MRAYNASKSKNKEFVKFTKGLLCISSGLNAVPNNNKSKHIAPVVMKRRWIVCKNCGGTQLEHSLMFIHSKMLYGSRYEKFCNDQEWTGDVTRLTRTSLMRRFKLLVGVDLPRNFDRTLLIEKGPLAIIEKYKSLD
ncbi:MAG: hypothetical protein ACRCX2_15625 [Paraclostridium sp.]